MARTLLFGLLLCGAVAAEEITLIKDGKSDYVIALPEEPSPAEERCAKEVQRSLKEMSGVELPIVRDDSAASKACIVIGFLPYEANDKPNTVLEGLGEEGYLLRTFGRDVTLFGGRRGVLYAGYALLDALGVRWYTPKVTRTPVRSTVTLGPIDEVGMPAFEYREPFFTEAFDRDWAARNRVNGASMQLDESTGGKVTYHPFVHTFEEIVPGTLYAEHPEYFSLLDGKRFAGYGQRCLSNPDVIKLAIEKVREWIRTHPEAQIYSVSQNDCGNWCQCDACRAITEKHGAHSGLYLWFVNQVAEAIEKDHPDKLIDTLAYQFTEAPPKDIVPRKNVRVRLCPIACCEAHPYESCSAAPNKAFLEHLKGWGAITDTLYIWHYNTDFAHYLMPFPDFDEFPAEARLYKKCGVRGIFFEGAYAPGGGGSDAELRSWVMARLLWNPDEDSDALVTEWMKGVYGAAWEPMRKWFDLLHERARDPNHHFYIYDPPTHPIFSEEVLAAGDALFDEAEKLATGDAIAVEYVWKARISLRYVELARAPKEGPELDGFFADLRKLGVTQPREGQPLDAWEADFRKRAR